ncbi:hypothetical protein [Fervidibacillus halotolerans]|uniref:Uncharacterized protein n=1 Tax=Fervidibacillus halotolerans TaxID=2980027 RepID=A0A9E8M200_9BACI|nr:hypothetical protein [Fervidibacillus halotolerans]WAA13507.1 hypothetical protein OE105_05200 [Fervidibacillus halotolerans]
MLIQRLWERYSYVILLLIVTFICGLLSVHLLTKNESNTNMEKERVEMQIVDNSLNSNPFD